MTEIQLSQFLAEAGDRPYRELIQFHIKRQSTAELQNSGVGEVALLPPDLQPQAIGYIDAVNHRFGYDKEFWERATCWIAFEAIVDTAMESLRLGGRITSVEDALQPESHELSFTLFQIATLAFAYSASTQPAQQEFMGIRKEISGE
jgi:hypothetical protein